MIYKKIAKVPEIKLNKMVLIFLYGMIFIKSK
jgi:hypothetical protein